MSYVNFENFIAFIVVLLLEIMLIDSASSVIKK